MELKEAQKQVDNWINNFEDSYWPPLAQLAALTEETGELAREISNAETQKKKKDPACNLKTEIGDVLFALICIANSYNISLEEALNDTLTKYKQRDKDRWKKKAVKSCLIYP